MEVAVMCPHEPQAPLQLCHLPLQVLGEPLSPAPWAGPAPFPRDVGEAVLLCFQGDRLWPGAYYVPGCVLRGFLGVCLLTITVI